LHHWGVRTRFNGSGSNEKSPPGKVMRAGSNGDVLTKQG
jgi:hypothetical protein